MLSDICPADSRSTGAQKRKVRFCTRRDGHWWQLTDTGQKAAAKINVWTLFEPGDESFIQLSRNELILFTQMWKTTVSSWTLLPPRKCLRHKLLHAGIKLSESWLFQNTSLIFLNKSQSLKDKTQVAYDASKIRPPLFSITPPAAAVCGHFVPRRLETFLNKDLFWSSGAPEKNKNVCVLAPCLDKHVSKAALLTCFYWAFSKVEKMDGEMFTLNLSWNNRYCLVRNCSRDSLFWQEINDNMELFPLSWFEWKFFELLLVFLIQPYSGMDLLCSIFLHS